MADIPNRCENCIFVQFNTYDDTYECYNPCCAVMDTRKGGRCEYRITESDLHEYYKARKESTPTVVNWERAKPCKYVNDDGYCTCEHLVESVRRSANNVDYNPECLFVGIWNQARVICMAYEAKVQRFRLFINRGEGVKEEIPGCIFYSRERAEKFIKERIEIIEVE